MDGQQFAVVNGRLLAAGKAITLPYPVGKVEVFNEIAVVLLDPDPGSCFNENVFGVSVKGQVLWQIKREGHVYEDSPYTGVSRDGDLARIANWDGSDIWLKPLTGLIERRGYSK